MISAQLGITFDNLPEALFPIMTGNMQTGDDGGPIIHVEEYNLQQAISILDGMGRSTSLIRVGGKIYQLSLNHSIPLGTVIGGNVTTPGPIIGGAGQVRPEQVIPNYNDQQDVDEDEDEDENEDEAEDEAEVENDDEGLDRIVEGVPSVVNRRIEGDRITAMVAASLENEMSNTARNLSDRINAFQMKWTAMIEESRKIQEATVLLESNPIIENIIRQANQIREADNLINEVFYIDGHVVFVTNELVTDNVINGHRRKIGRMEIQVSLKALVSQNSTTPKPIIIRNLDRTFVEHGTHFQCGHIKNNVNICWGNAVESLYNSIRDRDLESVLEVVIRFIKNPNIADVYGKHMKHWPSAY